MILVGWKDIAKAWGFENESIQVTRRRARKWRMPYFRDGKRPAIDETVLKLWWAKAMSKMPIELK